MNKKQYEAMRKKLMDEAEGLINEGKIKEVDSLEQKFQNRKIFITLRNIELPS